MKSWIPEKGYVEETNIYKFMESKGFGRLEDFLNYSTSPEFWWEFTRWRFRVRGELEHILDTSRGREFPRWFVGLSMNATDPMDPGHDVIEVREDGNVRRVTWTTFWSWVRSISSWIRRWGIEKGDRVAIYMPMRASTVAVFLGVVRSGAIAVPMFSGFGVEALRTRVEDSRPRLIFTADTYLRKNREVDMLSTASRLRLEMVVDSRSREVKDSTPLEHILRTPGDGREETSPEDPLMILYTSGTTGKPKGCVHTHGGFPVKSSADAYFHFDVKEGEGVTWITDMGWMMGPWLVFGTLLNRGSLVLFEGFPGREGMEAVSSVASILGLSASLIRQMKASHAEVRARILGNTGEPIDIDSWEWAYSMTRAPLINYSGGTEISGGILGNYLVREIRPSSFNGHSPGTRAEVYREDGTPAGPGEEGELVVTSIWPGMTRGFWMDETRYLETYWRRFPGVWTHWDLAYRDNESYFFIVGRSDDTIKVAGKRIGPAEIESVLDSSPGVIESACVGVENKIKGEEIVCLYVGGEVSEETLKERVERSLGRAFTPSRVIRVSDLPKTRNAKIMRRVIRAVLTGDRLGDISSLENPDSIEEVKRALWKP